MRGNKIFPSTAVCPLPHEELGEVQADKLIRSKMPVQSGPKYEAQYHGRLTKKTHQYTCIKLFLYSVLVHCDIRL